MSYIGASQAVGGIPSSHQAKEDWSRNYPNTTIPMSTGVDPITNLIANNERLLRDNVNLQERLRKHEENPFGRYPDWAWDEVNYGLSLMGQLLVRMQKLIREQTPLMTSVPGCRINYGGVGVVECFPVTYEGNPSVAVFTIVKGQALTVFDNESLFPSDELIVKLMTLAD